MKLTSDTILITGGASRIGFEMAKQLIARGNKVIITGRNKSKLDQAGTGCRKWKSPKLSRP